MKLNIDVVTFTDMVHVQLYSLPSAASHSQWPAISMLTHCAVTMISDDSHIKESTVLLDVL